MKLPRNNNVDILLGAKFYEQLIERERKIVEGIRSTKFGYVISSSQKLNFNRTLVTIKFFNLPFFTKRLRDLGFM